MHRVDSIIPETPPDSVSSSDGRNRGGDAEFGKEVEGRSDDEEVSVA